MARLLRTMSSGVLVTGGDVKEVDVWTIGTQTKALVDMHACALGVHCTGRERVRPTLWGPGDVKAACPLPA